MMIITVIIATLNSDKNNNDYGLFMKIILLMT